MSIGPTTSEPALLQAWRRGDKAAADLLIARYGPRLYNFFATKVGQGADELCQQTLQACVEMDDPLEDDGSRHSVRALVFTVARRRLLERYRHERESQPERQPVDPLEHSVADLEPGVSEAVAAHEPQRHLGLALRQLPLDFQVALELSHWEGLTMAELARVLEAPEAVLEARVAKARARLQVQLAREHAQAEHTVEGLASEDDRSPR